MQPKWPPPARRYRQGTLAGVCKPSLPRHRFPSFRSASSARTAWLDLGPHDHLCRTSHDALDAVRCTHRPCGSPEPDSSARSWTAGGSQPRRMDRASHRAAHRARVRGTSLDSSSHPETPCSRASRMSGRSRAGIGVSTTLGAIATTRICLLARSRAATRVTL